VEYVEPECVDEVCVPHCVEPPPPPPCVTWHEVEVTDDCGPPCEQDPDICEKAACAAAFANDFALKVGLSLRAVDADGSGVDDRLENIAKALKSYVDKSQQPRSEDARVLHAAAVGAAIIGKLDNSDTYDQVVTFSVVVNQLAWILFQSLMCSRSCEALKLARKIASFYCALSTRPWNAGAKQKASEERLPLMDAFVDYFKTGQRSQELIRKYQLVEFDAFYMTPGAITHPDALWDTLRGFCDAIQDETEYDRNPAGGFGDESVNFIYGRWDYTFGEMKAMLGSNFECSLKTLPGEGGPPQPKKAAPAPAPEPESAPETETEPEPESTPVSTTATTTTTATTATTATTTTTTPTTTAAPATTAKPPSQSEPTPLPPPPTQSPALLQSTPTPTATAPGELPLTLQKFNNRLIGKKAAIVNDDDDDEFSDEFEQQLPTAAAAAAAKRVTFEDLLAKHS
jgi:hypothetical protein